MARNPAAFYATKIGTGILMGLLADKIAKDGHPTLAKIIAGVNIALPLGAGASNAMRSRK